MPLTQHEKPMVTRLLHLKRRVAALFALQLLSGIQSAVCADTVHYNIKHFTDENGLPQNSVKFITMDKAGFVWLATENGLVRFEGDHYFRTFNKNELNISSSRIGALYPAPGNNEFAAITEFHQVILINQGKVTMQPGKATDYDGYKKLIYHEGSDTYPIIGLPNVHEKDINTSRYLVPAGTGAYFMISTDSVAFIRRQQQEYSLRFHHTRPWNFFPLNGELYYLNGLGEVVRLNRDQVKRVALTGDILQCPAYKSRRLNMKLYWNFAAEQVFIYLDSSCFILEHRPDGSLHTRLVVQGFDFLMNEIMPVYYDALHERVYVGSLIRGLYVFTRQPFHVLSGKERNDEVYYAQAALGKNQVLTAQGIRFDSTGSSVVLTQLRAKNNTRDRYSMVTDRWENIWYKDDRTLYKFNSNGQLLWQWECSSHINQLYIGNDDRLWIGARTGGLYCLQAAATPEAPALFSEQLTGASYLQQETPDLLWLGTRKGLYRLHLSSRHIDTIPGFENRYIRSLNIPRAGQVWITTYDDGFFLYRHNRLTAFPLDQHKYLQTAHCIVPDDNGYCWITTNKGLFQAAQQDLLAYADKQQPYVYYHYYGKDKGFNTNEFNGGCEPCGIKWENGNISLPSMEGLVYFSPAAISAELPDKEIHIDQATLSGKPLLYGDTLVLPSAFRQLELRVSVPYFGDALNLQVIYTLAAAEEENRAWLPLSNDHILSFSTLPSGTYRLHVRKINGFGKNNYTEKIILITVQQAYYETVWFRLLMLLLLTIGIAVYTRLRTHQVKIQNQELEFRVAERTAALETTMASLADSEKKLRRQTRTQERLIASISHDIKTPMKYLMILAGNMSGNNEHALKPEMIAKSAGAIYDTSYRMYHLLENLIQYIRTHIKNGSAVPEEIDLHELLEEKINIFNSIAQSLSVSIENKVPADLQFLAHYPMLAVVLHNLLDNAVKNTVNGTIWLSAQHVDGKVLITIADTGSGLPLSILHWINNYHALNGRAEDASPMHGGIGLLIVMEMLELLNGKLVAANGPVKGAVMKLELPVVS